MGLVTFYDAVSIPAIPGEATIVAGYVDGRYETVSALRQQFPKAVVIEITVFGAPGIAVCDCESGDITPPQARRGRRPRYRRGAGRPSIATVRREHPWWPRLADLDLEFVRDVDNWVADYDGIAQVPEGCVAKQYKTNGFDSSVARQPGAPWPKRHLRVPRR